MPSNQRWLGTSTSFRGSCRMVVTGSSHASKASGRRKTTYAGTKLPASTSAVSSPKARRSDSSAQRYVLSSGSDQLASVVSSTVSSAVNSVASST
eukprot:scaffold15437_cov71-Phaeocystis_antarctica.AAC.6